MLPIICFSCGELLADKQLEFEEILEHIKKNNMKHEDAIKLFDTIGLTSYCCKMRLMSYLQCHQT